MPTRVLGMLALATAVLVASPSVAAPPPAHIVDAAGDANGINSQGSPVLQAHNPDSKTPKLAKQLDSMDILSVRFATEFSGKGKRRHAAAVLVTMALAADPAADQTPHKYVVTFFTAGCEAPHQLEWHFTPANLPGTPNQVGDYTVWTRGAQFIRGSCFNDGRTIPLPASRLKGSTITFKIPIYELGRTGTPLSRMSAESRSRWRSNNAYSMPVWDYATSAKKYVVGK